MTQIAPIGKILAVAMYIATAANGTLLLQAGDAPTPEVVAVINGKSITASELQRRVGGKLQRLEAQEFDIRTTALREIIDETLIAAMAGDHGMTVDEYVRHEIAGSAPAVTSDEARVLIESSPAIYQRFSPDRALKQAAETIAARRSMKQKQDLIASLRKTASIEIFLVPPRVESLPLDGQQKGTDSAPVSIIEFTDFQCPYCAALSASLGRIVSEFGSTVSLKSKQFPLITVHPQAQKASEAALCAADQGKYWQMHDTLFTEQELVGQQQFEEIARRAGVAEELFAPCLATDQHAAEIAHDKKDGLALGITSTPTWFVNGRMIVGSKPYEEIRALVREELQITSAAADNGH